MRDLDITLLSDGCAAFEPALHEVAVAALRPVAQVTTVAEALVRLGQLPAKATLDRGRPDLE
jgi:ureidoacrylate peracid hydrolase